MELLARTRIAMGEGIGLWLIDATPAAGAHRRTDRHAHHAIQVTISLGADFRLYTADSELGGEAVAVAPDAIHAFEAEGLLAMLFIEPESRAGRAIATSLFAVAGLAAVPPALLGDVREQLCELHRAPARDEAALLTLAKALVARLSGIATAPVPDLRVRKTIAWAAQQRGARLSLSQAAAVAGLSEGRLRHLFVEETGLPFKTYLLWLRLMRAVEEMAAGASLTEAAHGAGFADSAHFSRTFRRMFGIAPAALAIS